MAEENEDDGKEWFNASTRNLIGQSWIVKGTLDEISISLEDINTTRREKGWNLIFCQLADRKTMERAFKYRPYTVSVEEFVNYFKRWQ